MHSCENTIITVNRCFIYASLKFIMYNTTQNQFITLVCCLEKITRVQWLINPTSKESNSKQTYKNKNENKQYTCTFSPRRNKFSQRTQIKVFINTNISLAGFLVVFLLMFITSMALAYLLILPVFNVISRDIFKYVFFNFG